MSASVERVEGEWAGVFFVTPQRKLVVQWRDDIPGIDNPNMFGPFGGGVEPNDASPAEAAAREVAEETTLPEYLSFVPFAQQVAIRDLTNKPERRHYYYSFVSGLMVANMMIGEGQKPVLVEGADHERLIKNVRPVVSLLFSMLAAGHDMSERPVVQHL